MANSTLSSTSTPPSVIRPTRGACYPATTAATACTQMTRGMRRWATPWTSTCSTSCGESRRRSTMPRPRLGFRPRQLVIWRREPSPHGGNRQHNGHHDPMDTHTTMTPGCQVVQAASCRQHLRLTSSPCRRRRSSRSLPDLTTDGFDRCSGAWLGSGDPLSSDRHATVDRATVILDNRSSARRLRWRVQSVRPRALQTAASGPTRRSVLRGPRERGPAGHAHCHA